MADPFFAGFGITLKNMVIMEIIVSLSIQRQKKSLLRS